MSNYPEMMNNCYFCERNLGESSFLRLWDGNLYCRSCISNVSPKLLDYADSHSFIFEHINISSQEAMLNVLKVSAVLSPIAISIVLFICYHKNLDPTIGLTIIVVVLAVFTIIKLIDAWYCAKRIHGFIGIKDGTLTFRSTGCQTLTCDLHACSWYFGNASDASAYFKGMLYPRKVIILVYPLKIRYIFWMIYVKVPCGFDDAMKEIWEAFLTLSGVEKRKRCWLFKEHRSMSPNS